MRTVRAIALAIPHPQDDALLLTVRRPDDDDDLPGVWGLPAATVHLDESDAAAAARLGRLKLGAAATPGALLAEGAHRDAENELSMRLYAAALDADAPVLPTDAPLDGATRYADWRWAPVSSLSAGAAQGSLCCRLALEALGAAAR